MRQVFGFNISTEDRHVAEQAADAAARTLTFGEAPQNWNVQEVARGVWSVRVAVNWPEPVTVRHAAVSEARLEVLGRAPADAFAIYDRRKR